MKLQTFLDTLNRNNRKTRSWMHEVTIDWLKDKGVSHIAVDEDGYVFLWYGVARPLACYKDKQWLSVSWKADAWRDCEVGTTVGNVGYRPVNWHRMVFKVQ